MGIGLNGSDDDLGTARIDSERAGQETASPITETGSTTPFTGVFQACLLGRPALPSLLTSELSGWASRPELSIGDFSEAESCSGAATAIGGGDVEERDAAAVGEETESESPRTTEAQGETSPLRRDWGLLTPPPAVEAAAMAASVTGERGEWSLFRESAIMTIPN